jgi:hydroxymethylpyrimidine/phosphomethylpyrimidine kinase
MRTVLTIAGSDSSGRAGLQADLRTLAAHGVASRSAVTAVTAQDEGGVRAMLALPANLVAAQIDAAVRDAGAGLDATKIGMLGTAAIVAAVAEALARHRLVNVVIDPVLASSEGHALLAADAVPDLLARLIPLAAVVTPNAPEAALLSGVPIRTQADAREAAVRLHARGARAVIVKGGHLDGPADDLVFDGVTFTVLPGERLVTGRTHGTGCMFASAIAARLALGDDLLTAARAAKSYVRDRLLESTT